jgi:drug/metabolite transporter (DMT)-like permease
MNIKILLLISVLTASLGQVLFKKGMLSLSLKGITLTGGGLPKSIVSMLFSPYVLTGLFFYGLSTLLWLAALSKTQLSYAYPFTTLTFILVMLASYFIFSEAMPVNRIAGAALICCGILVISIK